MLDRIKKNADFSQRPVCFRLSERDRVQLGEGGAAEREGRQVHAQPPSVGSDSGPGAGLRSLGHRYTNHLRLFFLQKNALLVNMCFTNYCRRNIFNCDFK